MIDSLAIKHFKSIRKMRIDCNSINIFIGEPNTGKSNILEALGLFSWRSHGGNLAEYLRFHGMHDIFYDGNLTENLEIIVKNDDTLTLGMKFQNDLYHLESKINNAPVVIKGEPAALFNYSGELKSSSFSALAHFAFIRYFKYSRHCIFDHSFSDYLIPPSGSNLYALMMGNKVVRDTIVDFFKELDLQLMLKPSERTFEIVKQKDGLFISHPYDTISETLHKLLFYTASIESSREATLVLDDPGAVGFPTYAKFLAEKILEHNSNQYFIATHNPYLLETIMEKAPGEMVNVFYTYLKDHQTKVELLTEIQVSRLLESGFFFGLPSLLEEEAAEEME